jgi:NADH:ubiquinone oxidoreductase subunit E
MDGSRKHQIKVCINEHCCRNGSEKVFEALTHDTPTDCEIEKTGDCFRFCKQGPNVAVDGHVLHHMQPSNASRRARNEIDHPSVKKDAIGTRSIDELDDFLENL